MISYYALTCKSPGLYSCRDQKDSDGLQNACQKAIGWGCYTVSEISLQPYALWVHECRNVSKHPNAPPFQITWIKGLALVTIPKDSQACCIEFSSTPEVDTDRYIMDIIITIGKLHNLLTFRAHISLNFMGNNTRVYPDFVRVVWFSMRVKDLYARPHPCSSSCLHVWPIAHPVIVWIPVPCFVFWGGNFHLCFS